MAERTDEQLLDELVYAVASVVRHYGPGYNENGLKNIRKKLSMIDIRTDASYRVDMYDDDQFADFHQRIVNPDGWWANCDFEETVKDSRG